MNPFTFKVTCLVCGGPASGTIKHAAMAYDPTITLVHRDPGVCRYYLEKERKRLVAELTDPVFQIQQLGKQARDDMRRTITTNFDGLRKELGLTPA